VPAVAITPALRLSLSLKLSPLMRSSAWEYLSGWVNFQSATLGQFCVGGVFGGQLFDFFPIRDFLHFALPMSSLSQPAALFEEPIEPFDGETRRLFQPFAAVYFVMRNR
jgi:hypothetical protein